MAIGERDFSLVLPFRSGSGTHQLSILLAIGFVSEAKAAGA